MPSLKPATASPASTTGNCSRACWNRDAVRPRTGPATWRRASPRVLATGQEWSHFYYLNGGAEIARVEVPDWLADDPELLALSHAMLVKQCELGMGYPVAISEAHEQAVITGHDREEFRRLTLMLLEQRGLPTPESAKSFSKRRPWV